MDWNGLGEPLSIDQIDFRVQSVNKGGYATILAYKDARVDMDRLDAVVGRGKWQRKHERIGDTLYCSVGLYNDDIGEWVWVQDVGVPSNAESQKGEASDAFKRACFNLGIGRELYEFPSISVKLNSDEWEMKKQGNYDKATATYKLKIREWQWVMERDDTGITFLGAKDQNGTIRFQWGRATGGSRGYTAETKQKFDYYLNEGTDIEFFGFWFFQPEEVSQALFGSFPDGNKMAGKKQVNTKQEAGRAECLRLIDLVQSDDEEVRETALDGLNDIEKRVVAKFKRYLDQMDEYKRNGGDFPEKETLHEEG